MLISRRSRRTSKVFRSRFGDDTGLAFPLRQYLRCREGLISGALHFLLLVAFTVAIILFGHTVDNLLRRHGAELAPWIRWATLVAFAALVLLLIRRLVVRVRELRETWRELGRWKAEMSRRPDSGADSA
jgi:hypothetical protein